MLIKYMLKHKRRILFQITAVFNNLFATFKNISMKQNITVRKNIISRCRTIKTHHTSTTIKVIQFIKQV